MSHTLVRELIEKMGGEEAVAAMTGVRGTSPSVWKARGRFPSNSFLLHRDELRRRGHLANDEEPPASLWGMKTRRTSKRLPRGSN